MGARRDLASLVGGHFASQQNRWQRSCNHGIFRGIFHLVSETPDIPWPFRDIHSRVRFVMPLCRKERLALEKHIVVLNRLPSLLIGSHSCCRFTPCFSLVGFTWSGFSDGNKLDSLTFYNGNSCKTRLVHPTFPDKFAEPQCNEFVWIFVPGMYVKLHELSQDLGNTL